MIVTRLLLFFLVYTTLLFVVGWGGESGIHDTASISGVFIFCWAEVFCVFVALYPDLFLFFIYIFF